MKDLIVKHRIKILIIISILTLFFSLTLTSFAFYNFNGKTQSNAYRVQTNINCFRLSLLKNSLVNLSDITPVHDYDAIRDDYRASIDIVNDCDKDINYTLYLIPYENTIGVDKLRYSVYSDLNKLPNCGNSLYKVSNVKTFTQTEINDLQLTNKVYGDSIPSTAYAIDFSSAPSNNTKTVYIDVWIDYYEGDLENSNNYDSSTLNKVFKSYVALKTGVNEYNTHSNCD